MIGSNNNIKKISNLFGGYAKIILFYIFLAFVLLIYFRFGVPENFDDLKGYYEELLEVPVTDIPLKHEIEETNYYKQEELAAMTTTTTTPAPTTIAITTEKIDEPREPEIDKSNWKPKFSIPAAQPVQTTQPSFPKNYYKDYFAQTITSKTKSRTPKEIKNVLIFSEYRSGSTFIGEIFNQLPDFFYLFEPLHVLTGFTGTCGKNFGACSTSKNNHSRFNRTIDELSINILRQYFTGCFLPWASVYIDPAWLETMGDAIKLVYQQCLSEQICDRGRHARFVDQRYCPDRENKIRFQDMVRQFEITMGRSAAKPHDIRYATGETPGAQRRAKLLEALKNKDEEIEDEDRPKNRKKRRAELPCPPINTTFAELQCQNTKLRTAKVVKLRQLSLLEDIFGPELNDKYLGNKSLEVLLLVRDPRGLANSRLEMIADPDGKQNTITGFREICNSYKRNLKYLKNHNYHNIQIIRYEDFVIQPFNRSSILLTSLGQYPTYKKLTQFYNLNMGWRRDAGHYGTAREFPIENAFGWRKGLKMNEIELVQKNCRGVMSELGYRIVTEEYDEGTMEIIDSMEPFEEWTRSFQQNF